MTKLRNWIECFRSFNLESSLRKLAWDLDLDIDLYTSKHILRKTIFFKVEGEPEQIQKFEERIEEYVRRTTEQDVNSPSVVLGA